MKICIWLFHLYRMISIWWKLSKATVIFRMFSRILTRVFDVFHSNIVLIGITVVSTLIRMGLGTRFINMFIVFPFWAISRRCWSLIEFFLLRNNSSSQSFLLKNLPSPLPGLLQQCTGKFQKGLRIRSLRFDMIRWVIIAWLLFNGKVGGFNCRCKLPIAVQLPHRDLLRWPWGSLQITSHILYLCENRNDYNNH